MQGSPATTQPESATDSIAARRGTIVLRDATVVSNTAFEGAQYVMRLEVDDIPQRARPGSFVHIQCDPALPMRRPMSIMRVSASGGWLDMLYKVHGTGTDLLATRKAGDVISVLGPIGQPFKLAGYRSRPLLMGGGVGIPPMVFLAEHMRRAMPDVKPLVLIASEVPFPFRPHPSKIMLPGLPGDVIAAMPLLEDWGIPSRLASRQGYAGCFDGLITDLARVWLSQLDTAMRADVEVFACGPTPMLRAVQSLAAEFSLPGELSVEEFMACAVGGCAGCAVRLNTSAGPAMKRVCVDGPVFIAAEIDFGSG